MSTTAAEPRPTGVVRPGRQGAAGAGDRLRRSLVAGLLFALGGLAWWWLATHHFIGADTHPAATPRGDRGAEGLAEEVAIRPVAVAAAGIETAPVVRRPLRDHLTVPGRIDYDARLRLDYAAPVGGIISQVLVQVRQRVAKGDALAEISSPEVGMARDEIRRREDERAIARKAAEWATTVSDNVDALVETLAARPLLAEVEEGFKDRVLGQYREKLLAAYSRLVFVEKVIVGTRSLGEGAVSARLVEERTSNLEVARANFAAACEESRFETRQDRDRTRASLASADRLVEVSREYLRTLVGSRLGAEATALLDAGENGEGSPGDSSSLSTLVLKTPFDGVVEDVFVSRGERVQAGDPMFVVADTRRLWVRAQIHEREWTAVEVAVGQEIDVVVPGAERHEAVARVHHVGATVEADSRSVPLVAELSNADEDAHLKPGMFVWVDLPQGAIRDALVVPAAAVMRHEGRTFVFAPLGDNRYRRIDVTTGIETGDDVEIVSGLDAGQPVVVAGGFVLKSELLLEKED